MMRCPEFRYATPRTVEEACAILAAEGEGATLLGGGTDVIPGMKRRTQTPAVLVSLRAVAGLRDVALEADEAARIGAGLTLTQIAADARLRPFAALQRAAAQVATPHIRNAGTLGGNLCVDTRCNYYDQNHEWRQAIDFCMKKEGPNPKANCWVAPWSRR